MPTGEDGPRPVTGHVECDVCRAQVPIHGKATAALTLGMHKKKEHGIAGKHARGDSAGSERAPTDLGAERPALLTVLHEAGDEVAGGKRAPNADDLTRALGKAYGVCSLLAWGWMVDSDPRYQTDDERQTVVQDLAPTASEAAATVRPAARALAQLDIVKRHGRQIVDNIDALDTVYVIAEQFRRGRQYIAERREYERALAGGGVSPLRPAGAPTGLSANVPPDAAFMPAGAAPPTDNSVAGVAPGTVVSYEHLHGGQSPHAAFPDATGEM